MEDYRLDIIIGSGPAAQTVKIDLPTIYTNWEQQQLECYQIP